MRMFALVTTFGLATTAFPAAASSSPSIASPRLHTPASAHAIVSKCASKSSKTGSASSFAEEDVAEGAIAEEARPAEEAAPDAATPAGSTDDRRIGIGGDWASPCPWGGRPIGRRRSSGPPGRLPARSREGGHVETGDNLLSLVASAAGQSQSFSMNRFGFDVGGGYVISKELPINSFNLITTDFSGSDKTYLTGITLTAGYEARF